MMQGRRFQLVMISMRLGIRQLKLISYIFLRIVASKCRSLSYELRNYLDKYYLGKFLKSISLDEKEIRTNNILSTLVSGIYSLGNSAKNLISAIEKEHDMKNGSVNQTDSMCNTYVKTVNIVKMSTQHNRHAGVNVKEDTDAGMQHINHREVKTVDITNTTVQNIEHAEVKTKHTTKVAKQLVENDKVET